MEELNQIAGYLLGVILGNGKFDKDDRSIYVNINNSRLSFKIVDLFESLNEEFDDLLGNFYTSLQKSKGLIRLDVDDDFFKTYLGQLVLRSSILNNRFNFQKLTNEEQIGILLGLIDTSCNTNFGDLTVEEIGYKIFSEDKYARIKFKIKYNKFVAEKVNEMIQSIFSIEKGSISNYDKYYTMIYFDRFKAIKLGYYLNPYLDSLRLIDDDKNRLTIKKYSKFYEVYNELKQHNKNNILEEVIEEEPEIEELDEEETIDNMLTKLDYEDIVNNILNKIGNMTTNKEKPFHDKKEAKEEIHKKLYRKLLDEINKEKENEFMPNIKIENDKFVVLSDLHIPYYRKDIIDKIIEIYGNKGFDLIINGDLLDIESLSTFTKAKQTVLEDEYNKALELLKIFSEKFERVYLIEGNHERRLRRSLMSIPEFVQVSFMYEPDILVNLSEGKRFKEGKYVDSYEFDNVFYYRSFGLKFGKELYILHPNNFRATPGSTVRLAIEYVLANDKNVKYVMIGHTHQIQFINYLGIKGYETGCLTKPLSYEKSGRISLKRTQLGFAEVYFDKDSQEVEDIRIISLDRG